MRSFKNMLQLSILIVAFQFAFISCNEAKGSKHAHKMEMEETVVAKEHSLPNPLNLVEVTTTGMNFILPDTITSGWTSFRYTNKSSWAHFILIDKLPVIEGKQKTYNDFKEIAPVFVDAMDLINEGKAEEGFAEFSRLPSWFPEIIFSGGVGIISPGETAQTTVYVEPGTYAIECYIKTGGKFHPMTKELIVKKSNVHEVPPTPTLKLSISKDAGIKMKDVPVAGLQTIAVNFIDQEPHEHFLGHDVHLVKLDADADLEELDSWMSWTTPEGLNTPAPARFLGGAQEMPAGNTAYITVDLEPGNYAWVAEVPNPEGKNMLKTFSIPENKSQRISAGKE